MSQTEDQYAVECTAWQQRAEQAEALVERIAALMHQIDERPASIVNEIQELLADPTGARLAEEQRALAVLRERADRWRDAGNEKAAHVLTCMACASTEKKGRWCEIGVALSKQVLRAAQGIRDALADIEVLSNAIDPRAAVERARGGAK